MMPIHIIPTWFRLDVQLAEMIKDMTNSSSDVVLVPYEKEYGEDFEDSRRRVPAIEKAQRVLDFTAKVPLSKGLEQTIDWFRRGK